MNDLAKAYSDVKGLPDDMLYRELNSPSGMIPGYMIMSELNDRRSMRDEKAGNPNPPTMASEYAVKGYAQGGRVQALAQLNPFEYYTKALHNFHGIDQTPNPQPGPLQPAPDMNNPMTPVGLDTLIPPQPGQLRDPQQPRGYAYGGIVIDPRRKAFLDALAARESGGRYNVMYGGGTFSDYSQHPGIAHAITSGPNAGQTSSAAGRYQFLNSTWKDEQRRLGLPDFSPQSQDQAAWDLANRSYGGNLDAALTDPMSAAQAATKLHPIWTSLPGGIEQGTTINEFANNFAKSLGSPQALAAGIPANVATGAAAAQAANAATVAATPAAADPLSGIMGLLAMSSMQQQQTPPPAPMAAPRKFAAPTDPVQVTQDTSMTPDVYRRRMMYG